MSSPPQIAPTDPRLRKTPGAADIATDMAPAEMQLAVPRSVNGMTQWIRSN